MKGKNISSISSTIILVSVALYMYYITGSYINSTIWIIASPLFLSLHPIFREDAKKMEMDKNEHEKFKAILNFVRFSLFALGMFMFLYQIFYDIL